MPQIKNLTIAQLGSHSKNVNHAQGYSDESIASIAISIQSLGLLQNLVVQQEDGVDHIGVLAGGRRMAAIKKLLDDGKWSEDTKIPCLIIPKSTDAVTAISLAENTQQSMDPLSEYEAFAKMVDEGMTVEDIADVFSTVIRSVKERLRFGKVHPKIRNAARDKSISLDVMKTFACHPCQDTQLRCFEAAVQNNWIRDAWRIRDALNSVGTRADESIGKLVLTTYQERKGDMTTGLFPEDTILNDQNLVQQILLEKIKEVGERERDLWDLEWVEPMLTHDRSIISTYGQLSVQPRKPTKKSETKIAKIQSRMENIEIDCEDENLDPDRYDLLQDEFEKLERDLHYLQYEYSPEDRKRAGVIAVWNNGDFEFLIGKIRPEDRADPKATIVKSTSNHSVSPKATCSNASIETRSGNNESDESDQSEGKLSNTHIDDLSVERAIAIQAAVTEDPDIAYDIAVFELATSFFGRGFASGFLNISARAASRTHTRQDALDENHQVRIETAYKNINLHFLSDDLNQAEQFDAFCNLESDEKAKILAYIVGATIAPMRYSDSRNPAFSDATCNQIIPNIRDEWTPTDANFWSRVSRNYMLARLKEFGMTTEADAYKTSKKATLSAYMEKLFAEPFATLTAEQHLLINDWRPEPMNTLHPYYAVMEKEGDDDEQAA